MSVVRLQQASFVHGMDTTVVDLLAESFQSYKVDKDLVTCLSNVSLDR